MGLGLAIQGHSLKERFFIDFGYVGSLPYGRKKILDIHLDSILHYPSTSKQKLGK